MITETTTGKVRGAEPGAVTAFRGIPYAHAARFAAPGPVTPWAGVRAAEEPGPAAPQLPSRLASLMGRYELAQDEDCLTVNVWAPPGSGHPVFVFLHGGGFSSGAGSLAWYDGAELAERENIVVVTANYRLGALGYLRRPGVSPGNLGLRDQLAALRWVHANITEFGGDPRAVTIAGQSAGAYSILALLGSGQLTGLAHRAILQSTPTGLPPQAPEEAERIAPRLLKELAIAPDDALRLRDVPVTDLLAAQAVVMRSAPDATSPVPAFHLIAEADLVPTDLLAAAGKHSGAVELMIGSNRDEGTAFAPNNPDAARAVTEEMFTAPTHQLARLVGEKQQPWLYRFDWAPAESPLGACHCLELPFVFGNAAAWRDAPMLAGRHPTDLTTRVMRAWGGFVRDGSPGWASGTTYSIDER
ncbi:carboxylesterase/lipase family protein [Nocardia callitridis]|uniref:Carboxylic ester hydrolase n=1 Tax=Nocardia callitridis TaxID=648753 RepID=A0ABP9KSS8_9NOCA